VVKGFRAPAGAGENFSRGIDVDAFAPLARTGRPFAVKDGMLDPFARTQQLSKPLIAVVHGDTWLGTGPSAG
jgi:enoyl-CoA hydratase